MRPRFSLQVVVLAMTLAIVVGTAVFGFLAQSVVPYSTWANPERAIAAMIGQVLAIVALGSLAGTLGWAAMFVLKLDGWHRLEKTAFLPYHYGGRSPWDTSDWNASR